MRRLILMVVVVVLVAGVIALPACKAAPAPAPAPTPAPAETFTWIFNHYDPPTGVTAELYGELVDKVAERSDGRLIIELYHGGELGYSGFELHRHASEGLIQMGQTVAMAVTELPIFQTMTQYIFKTREEQQVAYHTIKADLDKAAGTMNTKLLMGYAWPMLNWFTTRKLATADDFKGAKLRAWNPMLHKYLAGMGSAAHTCPYGEMYSAISTGVIEGTPNQVISMYEMKFYEIIDYINYWPHPGAFYVTFVNMDAFNALPTDLQQILLEAGEETEAEGAARLSPDGELFKERHQFFVDYGTELVYPSDEDLEKSRAVDRTIWMEWEETLSPEDKEVLHRALDAIGYE